MRYEEFGMSILVLIVTVFGLVVEAKAVSSVGQCGDYHTGCGGGSGGIGSGGSGGSSGGGFGSGGSTGGGGNSSPIADVNPSIDVGQTEPPVEVVAAAASPSLGGSELGDMLKGLLEPELVEPFRGQDLGEECAARVYEGELNQIVARLPLEVSGAEAWIQFDVYPGRLYIGDLHYFGYPNGFYEKVPMSNWPYYEAREFMFCAIDYGASGNNPEHLCVIDIVVPMHTAGRQINYAVRWRQINTGNQTHIMERCARIVEQE